VVKEDVRSNYSDETRLYLFFRYRPQLHFSTSSHLPRLSLTTLHDARRVHPPTRLASVASGSSAILPGTVNDATKFPPPDRTHGSYHWAFERVLSAALIPLTVGAAVTSGSAHVSNF
jgi:hypothetical protein